MTENHRVVDPDQWLAERKELLAKEKEFTRLRDQVSRQRRELPWERVEKEYVFEGADGRRTLAELFDGRSQLVVYHFMFGPDWEAGCKSCSFWADNFNGITAHLRQRDATLIAVSRAPLPKLQAFAKRLGWSFPWASSLQSDFNFDYGASFTPEDEGKEAAYNYSLPPNNPDREGVSVFLTDENGDIFHTYSAYARGIDLLNAAYNYLDIVPKGRDEEGPHAQSWVRRHDEYEHA